MSLFATRRALAVLAVPCVLAAGTAVAASTDVISHHAGSTSGGGPLDQPASVSPLGTDGTLLLADPAAGKIWRISPTGAITTHYDDGTQMSQPKGVSALPDGGMVVADAGRDELRRFPPSGSPVTLAAGLNNPTDVLRLSDGRFLVANGGDHQVLEIDGATQRVFADQSDGLDRPYDFSLESDGTVLVADYGAHRVFRLDPDVRGTVTRVAGTTSGFSGDNGLALSAKLEKPEGVAALAGGGFLVTDAGNRRIRRVSAGGTITTAVGTGADGNAGDGSAATSATLGDPADVALLPGGGFVFADLTRRRVRFVASGDRLPVAVATPTPTPAPSPSSTPAPSSTPTPTPTPPTGGGRPGGPADGVSGSTTPPEVGERVSVSAVRGTIRVRPAGSRTFVELDEGASIPVGSAIDATRGTVRLQSARDAQGTLQAAEFSDGAFTVRQARPKQGPAITDLVLSGGSFAGCAAAARRSVATASAARAKPVRRLWGSGHGRFRTRGRHSAATVRGTVWLTEDRCEGTATRVRRGVVSVRDLVRKKTFTVRAGDSHLARAPRR